MAPATAPPRPVRRGRRVIRFHPHRQQLGRRLFRKLKAYEVDSNDLKRIRRGQAIDVPWPDDELTGRRQLNCLRGFGTASVLTL